MLVRKAFGLLFVCAGVALNAQGTPSPALLVLSKVDQTLSIVDPLSLKVLSRIPTGPDPHEVVALLARQCSRLHSRDHDTQKSLAQ